MDPELQMQAGEMSPWASRRKTIILSAAVLALFGVSFSIFWKFWYRTPNCSDNLKNGDETGVDCGGSCARVCSGGAARPFARWDPRLFEISPGLWSAVVYVENPNADLEASYAPYSFTFYDAKNKVIGERKGATILPKGRTVGIFEGSLTFENGATPKRAVFELGEGAVWKKGGEEGGIKITHGPLLKLESVPRVEATVKNEGTEEVKDVELVIVVFDGADNAIAASRTFVERIKKNESANVFFTWPKPFELGTKVCEKPSDVMLLLDRSGSMAAAVGTSTALAGAKAAASSFIDQLSPKDKAGIVSFASAPKEPIDISLTSDFGAAKLAAQAVGIEAGTTQYTNISGAFHSAWQELASPRGSEGSSKIMVLLTDGVANNPKDPNGRTETDDIKYAENLALKEAADAKKDGVVIYTIGLGNKINDKFLKSAASAEDNYFFAPTVRDLGAIYKNISSDICEEVPARIEITYKVFGGEI